MGRKRKAKDSDRDDRSDTEDEIYVKKKTTRDTDKKKSFRELGKFRRIPKALVLFQLPHFQPSLRWTPPLMKIPTSVQFVVIGMIQIQ